MGFGDGDVILDENIILSLVNIIYLVWGSEGVECVLVCYRVLENSLVYCKLYI